MIHYVLVICSVPVLILLLVIMVAPLLYTPMPALLTAATETVYSVNGLSPDIVTCLTSPTLITLSLSLLVTTRTE